MQRPLFKRFLAIPTIFIAIICITAVPAPGATTASEIVSIGGTGAGLGAIQLLADAFERSHPGIRVTIVPSLGSSGGIRAVMQGALDCSISSRPLKEEEGKGGITSDLYARSPYAFVTFPGNRKAVVTTTELEKIYSGEMTTWSDGSRLRLVLRPETETDTMILKNISPGMGKAVTAALARPGMPVALTDQENAEMLVKTPGSFGMTTLTQMLTEKRALKVLSFNGLQPTVAALANNTYPLSKPLYLITSPKTSAAGRGFAAFILSGEGCGILRKSGNVCKEGMGRR
jgi:phosphate transport system substrate-binding protein